MTSTFSQLSTWVAGAVAATTLFASATPAYSAAITGSLNFNGSLTATLSSFDFLPPNGGTGDFTVQTFGNTGFFSTLTSTTGTIRDLNAGIAPAGTTISLANFLTFNSAPNVSFTLTKLLAGGSGQADCSAPAAPGQSCTPFAASPINFNNGTASSSTATFNVEGFFTDSSTGQSFLGTGQLSANFQTQNYQQILAILGTGGSIEGVPFTGAFNAVPEPDMLPSVLGLGIVIAGAATLRRRVAAAK
jgi:hypothetical protein